GAEGFASVQPDGRPRRHRRRRTPELHRPHPRPVQSLRPRSSRTRTGDRLMSQLLLEIFSEEIPARMQQGAARDLERMASDRLKAAGLTWDALTTYAGPRRLTLVIDGLPAATPDRNEELKGPKASAPAQALEGFLRKTGLTQEQLVERDGVWFAEISSKGRVTTEVVAESVDDIIRHFPWPK